MRIHVPGHPGRAQIAFRTALLLAALAVVAGPGAPRTAAADALAVTTPFPSIVAEPGATATFKLTLAAASAGDVKLSASGVPDGWTARFQGGGLVIDSAYVTPAAPVDVTLSLEIPDGAATTTSAIRVTATGRGGSATLPLSVRVQEAAGGDVTLTSDFPELRGPSSSTFTFNLKLENGTAAETTFSIDAKGPAGWTVTAKPAGQAQATSTTVPAGGTSSITVTAEAPGQADAATYPIAVAVAGAGKTATADLKVTITGTYTLDVSTANQVLSTRATAGTATDLQLALSNTGTAPVTGVTPSATAPTGWTVTFDPATVASIGPGETVNVTARITPTSDAITGDYSVAITAKAAEASGDVAIRVTVETPALWWVAGLALIVAVFAGLWWVFRTYGRR